jgi:3-oxoacyl-[acyl-carrier-protein] synthase-3
MAVLSISNVRIVGISACVPSQSFSVGDGISLTEPEVEKIKKNTGIYNRRIAPANICTSDLCMASAEKLIEELGWDKADIDLLIFVTQTPDYILPATSPLIQNRLGLSSNCFTLDISLGCSGYVYGLVTVASLMSSGNFKKALLLVGDTVAKFCSPNDKSTYPLFGDAGSATALIHDTLAKPILANMKSDGSGYESIIINDGGFRNMVNPNSLEEVFIEEGISRNNCQLVLNGTEVFSFGISKAPQVVSELMETFSIASDEIDYFIFHQANLFMNERIRKKLKLPEDKVPYSLKDFGNTSCATIPLTIVSQLSDDVKKNPLQMILCGFGVGLSWGSVKIDIDGIVCPDLIEI